MDEAIRLGGQFLIANQRPAGDFRYDVHLKTGERSGEQGEVRQAGVLWGLALTHRHRPSDETRAAVRRGIDFFKANSRVDETGQMRWIRYRQSFQGSTGTVALTALALIDWLQAEPKATVEDQRMLRQLVRFLRSLERHDGRFYQHYDVHTGEGWDPPSPYFDGESLLALVRAARLLGATDQQKQQLVKSAHTMYQKYGIDARKQVDDSPLTKGFYQWGVMSYYQLVSTGWEGTEDLADHAIDLSVWMVDVHRVTERKANTGYALEGLVLAAELARRGERGAEAQKFADAIAAGIKRHAGWQIGGPMMHPSVEKLGPFDQRAAGGVLNSLGNPYLRMDTAQHQNHAFILARTMKSWRALVKQPPREERLSRHR